MILRVGDTAVGEPLRRLAVSDEFEVLTPQIGIVNGDLFAHYTLGPDGVMWEFNANEGVVDPSNDPDPAGRENLNNP